MAMTVISWLIAIPLLGVCTGFRTMTPIALTCWYAWAGYLPVKDTWAGWIASPISVGVFTVLAAGEYVGDKLPRTPARVDPFPLIARLGFGGLVGALVATGLSGSAFEGIVLGVIGAILGTFGGYLLRRAAVDRTGWPDWRVALIEDAITITCSFFALGVITG